MVSLLSVHEWLVEVFVTGDHGELATYLDRWLRFTAPADTADLADRGVRIHHRTRAEAAEYATDESVEDVTRGFPGFPVRHESTTMGET
jgi:hypothetical protein